MPLRFVRGSYGRQAPTVIAVACGVALVCAMDLADRAALRAFTDVIDSAAGRVALQVRAGEGAAFPEEVVATVAAVPGVKLAGPVVSGTAFPADGSEDVLSVLAIDVGDKALVEAYGMHRDEGLELDDPFFLFSQPDSVVLTRTFAARRGVGIGDRIELVTPQGRRAFTVRGLLEPEASARVYGGNFVVMDVYAAEMVFTWPGFINRVDVVVEDGADVARVADAVAAALPSGLSVQSPSQRKVDLQNLTRSLQVMLQAVALLGLAAAFLIAFNRLGTVFEGRAAQLSVLRAVGVRTRTVWWELVKESLLVGGAGVTLGLPLGAALGHVLVPIITTTTALTYKLATPGAELAVHPSSFALAAGLGLGAALLAAVLPAWRATKLAVRDALIGRGEELPGLRTGSMWLARATVAGMVAIAIAMQSATGSATWGLVATGLIAVATALAARPLLAVVLPALVLPWLHRFTGPIGRFAMTTAIHNPRRMALTAATLGVGLGSILWLWTLAGSVERSVIDALAGGVRADFVVSASHTASSYIDAPVDERLLEQLAGVPGVMAVSGQRILDWHHAGSPIAIDALDARQLSTLAFDGSLPPPLLDDAVALGNAVNVSANFVLHRAAHVGDVMMLETPSGALAVRIAGVTSEILSPGGTIQMSRALYERYWHDSKISLAYVWAAPGADLAAVRTAITRTLAATYRVRILLWTEFIKYCATQVRRAFAGVHVLAGLVLVVVLLGMADTLAASVAERTREIGAIRTVGIRRWEVERMVLIEGLVLGTLGLVLAVAAGLALGGLWAEATFPYLMGWVLELHIPYTHVAMIVALALGVCLAAALVPARRAARLQPAVALRYE